MAKRYEEVDDGTPAAKEHFVVEAPVEAAPPPKSPEPVSPPPESPELVSSPLVSSPPESPELVSSPPESPEPAPPTAPSRKPIKIGAKRYEEVDDGTPAAKEARMRCLSFFSLCKLFRNGRKRDRNNAFNVDRKQYFVDCSGPALGPRRPAVLGAPPPLPPDTAPSRKPIKHLVKTTTTSTTSTTKQN